VIAMQIFGGGFINADDAIEYIKSIEGIDSILFGASTSDNINRTIQQLNI